MPDVPFIHLHLHSEYSLLDGACRVKDIPARAAELGMPAIAVTDHGNMHATIEFYRACQKAGVKPIIGMEAYVCDHSRLEKRDGRANTGHMVLLARNQTGYRNLLKLASSASLEGFYYTPRVDHELLAAHAEGIIALTACLGGEIPKIITAGDLERAKALCCWYQELFGPDGFYLELQDHNTPQRVFYAEQPRMNAALRGIAAELGIPLVVTNDTHYLLREDFDAHEVLICIGTQKTLDEHRQREMNYSTEQYLKSTEEMYAAFPDDVGALENTARIAELCDVSITLDEPQLPEFAIPAGATWDGVLREACETRLNAMYADDPAGAARARERLDYELGVISEKGLSPYFLIVRDFLDWARAQGILVGIRGSGAGAIVSYLTNISYLNPLEYGLWFERFLSLDRASMPDIDCDFEDRRRAEVIEYVVQKYGADKVAQVATFGTLQPRLAVRDAARVLGVPLTTADRLSKAIGMAKTIQEAIAGNPEIQDLQNQDPAVRHLLAMAGKLQGLARHLGTHAAAVVISQGPLVETAPLQRTPDGGAQTQWEYPMAEAAGLVKMDFLGLRTLTVLKDALTYIEQHHGVTYDLPTLPLDNARAYELMARGDTAGVFQLESVGMRNALRQLKPDRISDVIAMVALYRPGPMAEIPKFCLGKHDPGTITYLHPALEPILRETYGVLVYQEQVMAIGREVAGLNPADANDLLNALRKKNLDKMAKLEPVFLTGVKTTSGFTDTQAEALWDRLKEFAKYAFNKAHSACYALVAYQTAFLKANYPVEFMTALLTSVMDSQDKVSLYVAECRKLGIEVLAPDVNFSRVGFTVEDGGIRFGLTAIKGVGTGVVEAIVASREADGPFSDLFDFCARVGGTLCNRAALESLIKSGAMDGLPGNRAQKLALADAAVDMGQSAARDRAVGQVNLFGDMAATVQTIVPDLPPLPEFSAQELLTMERDFLGLYVSDHPIHAHEEALLEFRTASVEELAEARAGDEVVIGGMLTVVKPHVSKNGKQMAFLTLDDLTGAVEITVFAEPYEKARAFLKQDAIVLVKGTVDFGTFQRTPTTDDEEEEKPDPKLLAIAIAPIDDEAAIQELQRAAARRRGNGYGNGNGRHGGTSAAVTALPVYKPERPVHQGDGMTGAPNGNGKATRPCRICLSEAFVTSDDFATLPALLCSCRGDAPVEITVILANGARRRWRVPTITVNPDCVSKHLRILPGVSVAE